MVDSWKVDQNGIPIVGHKYSDILIDLSAPNVIKEYKNVLVGATVGDQKRVTVTYPPDHPKKELAGQTVSFLLKVKEAKKKILPILDDAFAQAISEYPTLETLKEGIYKRVLEKEEHRARRDVEEQIVDQIIEKNHFEVPESMIAGYVEALISDFHPGEKSADEQEQLRRSYRPMAVRMVKRWFILDEVRRRENLAVNDQELEARVKTMAVVNRADPKELHQHLAQSNELERLRRNLEEEKTLDFLVSKAEITSGPAEVEK
jgi:trigger factor